MAIIPLIRIHPNAVLPSRATPKSFGYDFVLPEAATIQTGQTVILGTGWRLAQDLPLAETTVLINGVPEAVGGVAFMVLPRSSTFLKYKLSVANSPGLIDADYTGEIGVIVHNFGQYDVTLPAGTRIAQGVFCYLDFMKLQEVDGGVEERTERGGFGSTGA